MSVALYCKSYSNDLLRLRSLIISIEKHNRDSLPVYVSAPNRDLRDTKTLLTGNDVILIADEDIVGKSLVNSQITQQIVKLSFWKLAKEEVILMLDSDSYFIRDFYERSFVDPKGTSYTVMHQQKDYFQFVARLCATNKLDPGIPKKGFFKDRFAIKRAIGVPIDGHTIIYDFGPSPYLWNSKVLESFNKGFLEAKNMSLDDCMSISASELSWYGEWLLHKRPIEILPVEPFFKVYHIPQQYHLAKSLNETEESLRENFYGIVLQSNWNAPCKF